MRKSHFSEEQIIGILCLAEAGQSVAEICRQHGISEGTYYRWKAQYGGLEVSQLRRLRQLEDENRKLKQIVADLTLDNTALARADLVPDDEPAEPMLPLTEALLLSAGRAQHVARIREWLEAGAVVVSDRFADATLAYQGYGRGYDLATLRTLQAMATGGLTPGLTLLLDLSVDEGLRRKHAGHEEGDEINRLDLEQRDFRERVRMGYLALAAAEPQRWVTLDATESMGALATQIWKVVAQRLPAPGDA